MAVLPDSHWRISEHCSGELHESMVLLISALGGIKTHNAKALLQNDVSQTHKLWFL